MGRANLDGKQMGTVSSLTKRKRAESQHDELTAGPQLLETLLLGSRSSRFGPDPPCGDREAVHPRDRGDEDDLLKRTGCRAPDAHDEGQDHQRKDEENREADQSQHWCAPSQPDNRYRIIAPIRTSWDPRGGPSQEERGAHREGGAHRELVCARLLSRSAVQPPHPRME